MADAMPAPRDLEAHEPAEDLGPLMARVPEAALYLAAILAIAILLAVLALGVIAT